MIVSQRVQLRQDIEGWVQQYGGDRSALLPVLQEIQKKYARITEFAQQVVADLLKIHPVEIYGVVTFYSFLNQRAAGKFTIRLCRTISCDMQGKDRVARQLENDLGIRFGETTPDGRFTLEWANCLGMCDQGPALLVNDQVVPHVTPDKVHQVLESCRHAFGAHTLQQQEVVLS